MNHTFSLFDTYQLEFTSNNIIKSDMLIEQISILNLYPQSEKFSLIMENVNNINERHQSPLMVINDEVYTKDIINVFVPKSRIWKFYLTDTNGKRIKLNHEIVVNLIFKCHQQINIPIKY